MVQQSPGLPALLRQVTVRLFLAHSPPLIETFFFLILLQESYRIAVNNKKKVMVQYSNIDKQEK